MEPTVVLDLIILFYKLSFISMVIAKSQFLFHSDININRFLGAFSNCLFHLTTYEFHIPHTNDSLNISQRFVEDFTPFQQPIIMSKYMIKPMNVTEHIKYYSDEENALNTGNQTAFLFPPRVHNIACVVQIYFIPQASKLPLHFLQGIKFIRDGHGSVISTKVRDFTSKWYSDKRNAPTLLKHEVYQVLITDDLDEKVLWSWGTQVDSESRGVRRETVANPFAKLLVKLSPESGELLEAFLMYSDGLNYVRISMMRHFSESLKNVSKIQPLINTMLTNIYRDGNCRYNGGLKHEGLFKFQLLAINMTLATKHFSVHTGYRFFQPWMSADLMLFHVIFPNCTMSLSSEEAEKTRVGGYVVFGDVAANYMAFEEDGFAFVTCGGGERGFVSLIGYVSAFDEWIRKFLLLSALGAAISAFLVNRLLDKGRTSIWDCVFMPLDTVLEQGSCLHNSGNGAPAVQYISAAWVLVGVVLSNAYKGQNITDLSSPVPPIKPTKFSQIVDKNFTIYTYSDNEQYMEEVAWTDPFIFNLLGNDNKYDMDRFSRKPNILSKLIKEADPTNDIVRKYISVHEKVYNFTALEESNLTTESSFVGYLEKIKDCDKTAFMGWTDEVETSRLHLDNILYNAGRQSDKGFISTSEETLFQLRKGWTFIDLPVVTEELPRKVSSVVESGLGKQWRKVEKFVKNLQLNIITHQRPKPLPTLKLNDNISVFFYVHVVLLAATSGVLMLEHCIGLLIIFRMIRIVSNLVFS